MRDEEERERQEQEMIRLAVTEKQMVLQDGEGEALVVKNPFEEVPSEDPFEDISSTNPFEEPSTAHSTEPLNRTTKVSAVKPRLVLVNLAHKYIIQYTVACTKLSHTHTVSLL